MMSTSGRTLQGIGTGPSRRSSVGWSAGTVPYGAGEGGPGEAPAGARPAAATALARTVVASRGALPSVPRSPAAGRSAVLPRTTAAATSAGPLEVPEAPRYEILSMLGEGGMGQVMLARDNDLERRVAIKRLRPELEYPAALLRFAEEVRAVGNLEHPGIVPAYDVGVDDEGQHYLVMKYVEGETLETIIDRLRARDPRYEARFTHAYRAQIFAAVLEAVDYAHRKGFVHRDLKPANLMVGPCGEVTVLDWGIAKLTGAAERPGTAPAAAGQRLLQTHAGAILGTLLYMSPEQAAGNAATADARSDVYSLSLIFWELMSLAHPLADLETMEQCLHALTEEEVSASWIGLTRIRSGAPCEWGWFAHKGLRRDPARRYASAGAMLAELRRVQRGEIPIQCNVTLAKRSMHELDFWIDRHGWVFHALTALVLVGSLVAMARLVMALEHG